MMVFRLAGECEIYRDRIGKSHITHVAWLMMIFLLKERTIAVNTMEYAMSLVACYKEKQLERLLKLQHNSITKKKQENEEIVWNFVLVSQMLYTPINKRKPLIAPFKIISTKFN